MFRHCAHNHTTFCDGKHTPEEMVRAALDLGFVCLGFSGHGQAVYDTASMTPEGEIAYRQEVRRLQQVYDGQIEILLGQEHDYPSPYADFQYDYLIESVHHLFRDGDCFDVDWEVPRMDRAIRAFGGPYEYAKAYFRACADAYAQSPAQIAGHIDLLTKFNEQDYRFDEQDPRFLEPAREALAVAVERGMVVEVNTGAMSRGYRTAPYPAPGLLRHVRELGGRVMVNSDCHNKEHLIYGYETARQLLLACGFDHVAVLSKGGFREIGIE